MEQLHPAWSFPYGARSQGISSHVIDHSHWTFQFPHRKRNKLCLHDRQCQLSGLDIHELDPGTVISLSYDCHETKLLVNYTLATWWSYMRPALGWGLLYQLLPFCYFFQFLPLSPKAEGVLSLSVCVRLCVRLRSEENLKLQNTFLRDGDTQLHLLVIRCGGTHIDGVGGGTYLGCILNVLLIWCCIVYWSRRLKGLSAFNNWLALNMTMNEIS